MQQLPHFGQRELTNSMHACHILQQHQPLRLLMAAFMEPDMLQQADAISLKAAIAVGKAEGMLDDKQVQQIAALLQPRDAAETAKQLWHAASQWQQLPHRQWREMVRDITSQHGRIGPHTCSYVLYAAAKMRKFLTQQQLQHLLAGLCGNLRVANAAAITTSLWALAVMRVEVPSELLQQLLSVMCSKAESSGDSVAGHQIATAVWVGMQLQQQMQARLASGGASGSKQQQQLLTRLQVHQLVSGMTDRLYTVVSASTARSLQACVYFR